jgi:hypothetical protein
MTEFFPILKPLCETLCHTLRPLFLHPSIQVRSVSYQQEVPHEIMRAQAPRSRQLQLIPERSGIVRASLGFHRLHFRFTGRDGVQDILDLVALRRDAVQLANCRVHLLSAA